ncbi:hypothetical protein ASE04_11225 [Rhizobium sp. Root708]|uniref:hypothetical protein n=1 Tax=Rhizobium sp. Root708 TaxID=1736592 RepID=UPI0006FD0747|nr:hypothetical protein [Rhizobium sp. Root708]KRB51344.1 hypothetical protein ASE04_11225 [Rhizobium sp. Root708]
MARIIIVGNGRVDRRFASTIDAADLVVRLDDCRSQGVAGTRTDIVAVRNFGQPARSVLESRKWQSQPAVQQATEIWGLNDPKKFNAIRPLVAVLHPELRDFCDDHSGEFDRLCAATSKVFRVVDERLHDWVDDALRFYGPGPYLVPSSEIILVAAVLDRFSGANVTIVGLEHSGPPYHPFAAERRLVDEYVAVGKLRRLAFAPHRWPKSAQVAESHW